MSGLPGPLGTELGLGPPPLPTKKVTKKLKKV